MDRAPTMTGRKLECGTKDSDVRIIAELEDGHLEILQAEADEWAAQKKEEGFEDETEDDEESEEDEEDEE